MNAKEPSRAATWKWRGWCRRIGCTLDQLPGGILAGLVWCIAYFQSGQTPTALHSCANHRFDAQRPSGFAVDSSELGLGAGESEVPCATDSLKVLPRSEMASRIVRQYARAIASSFDDNR